MSAESVEYRVKFSYALWMACVFVLATLGSIVAGLTTESLEFGISEIAIFVAFYLFYISKLLTGDSGGKWMQFTMTTIGGIVTVLALIFYGGLALAVIGAGFFGALGAYYTWVNLITRQPIIQADNDKLLLHNGLFKGRNFEIPWGDIGKLSIRTQHLFGGSKISCLVVNLVDPDRFKRQHNGKTMAKYMAMNEKMYDGQIAVSASHLDAGEQAILNQLNKYVKPQA